MAGEDGLAFGILGLRCPVFALPVNQMLGSLLGHAFPPDVAIVRESDISENGVAFYGIHGHWIAVVGGAWSHTKKSSLWIDRMKPAIRAGLDPCDVITDGADLPTLFLEHFGWDDHGEVGFTAGTRESRGHIGLGSRWVFDTQDEHVLGHPSFVPGHG